MRPLCCLSDISAVVILDASAAINLNATGRAADILDCIPNKFMLPEIVLSELDFGNSRGRRDAEMTKGLITAKLISVESLSELSFRHFEQLVVGNAAETLDDGEAATIAIAIETNAVAIVDERKANRICAERFAALKLAATVDLFAHPNVQHALGRDGLADSVFNALSVARMRVFRHHLDWVIDLVGPKRAAECSSLPRSARARPSTVN